MNGQHDRQDVVHLAKGVPLSAAILTARYRDELRLYLPEVKQNWHDQTLELWIEEFFDWTQHISKSITCKILRAVVRFFPAL